MKRNVGHGCAAVAVVHVSVQTVAASASRNGNRRAGSVRSHRIADGRLVLLRVTSFADGSRVGTQDPLDRQRIIFFGSLGAIALMIAGLDEMFNSGAGTVVWFLIVGTAGYLAYTTWRQASSY